MDVTVLGALQVDEQGLLANWIVPGKMIPGMGGAMDLMAGAKTVIVAMEHCTKAGDSKILKACTLPITAQRPVDYIVTELAVLRVTTQGLELMEIAPDTTVEEVCSKTEAALILPDTIGVMS